MSPVYPSFVEPQLNQLESLISPAWSTQRPPSPLQRHTDFANPVDDRTPSLYASQQDPFTGDLKPIAATTQNQQNDSLLVPPLNTPGRGLTPSEVYRTLVKP